jgi:hypothetical protein
MIQRLVSTRAGIGHGQMAVKARRVDVGFL